jgi:PAS domain S-box-containing protein
LLGGAYYAGAWVGFATAFPGTGISIVWPPNVILLAALLVTPARRWWLYGPAALVAHLLAHAQIGVPPVVMLIQFGGNAVQAVLAALMLRRLTGTPWRDTLRSTIALIAVAGLVAPALASLLAAPAYVLAGWLPDYAFAWRVRVLSNLVSTLTLAPLLLAVASRGFRGLRDLGPRRVAEFAAVVAGLLVGSALLVPSVVGSDRLPLLFLPLPLLLWAAVRFGPPGLCVALFALALLFVGGIVDGPVLDSTPADNAVAVQAFLIAIAVPLHLLAALGEERRRAEAWIAESQQRYRLATAAGGVGVWDWDLETGRAYVDPVLKRMLGYAEDEMADTMEAWGARVHPDDAERVWAAARAHIEGHTPHYEIEHRMLHRDGSIRWFLARGAISARRQDRPVRMSGTDTDISEGKRAEEALGHSQRLIRELAARVMSAQEQERRHIAHELHDGLNQKVAALAISISTVKHRLARGGDGAERAAAELDALLRRTDELAAEVHALSHGLHPVALEHGGLVAGLRSFADEFSRVEDLDIAITAVGDVNTVARDIALSLYRVAQESIRNIARHSGARRAQVILTVDKASVELLVKDEGRGFDVARSRRGDGLGLVSIEERVRLLQGELLVTSRPGHGTDLLVRIPLARTAVYRRRESLAD